MARKPPDITKLVYGRTALVMSNLWDYDLDVVTVVSFLNIVTFLGVGHYILKIIVYLKL